MMIIIIIILIYRSACYIINILTFKRGDKMTQKEIKKLQEVREALMSLAYDRFGSVEAVDEVIQQAIADLDEYINRLNEKE